MNATWTTTPETTTITRNYTDPNGPVPTVTATITRAEARLWWNIAVTDGRDRWGNPRRTVIASGTLADTPHALPALKGRLTRLANAAARLERDTATAKAIAALSAAVDAAGTVQVHAAPTKNLRACAWERDMAAARVERLLAAA